MSRRHHPSPVPDRRHRAAAAAATVLTAVAVVAGSVGAAAPAQALSPAQTTYSGVVSALGFTQTGSIATFWSSTMSAWGVRYVKPGLYYYHSATVGDYVTTCGNTAALHNNSFYCSTGGNNAIYLDYTWNQSMTTRFGDFGSGGILAHEWGHAAQRWLGYASAGYRSEYHADCLAGMYTRWGYASGRLVGSDYSEMAGRLAAQPSGDGSHGPGSIRADWFRYGYQQYSLAACNQVFAKTANPTATATGATTRVVGVSSGPSSATAPTVGGLPPTVSPLPRTKGVAALPTRFTSTGAVGAAPSAAARP